MVITENVGYNRECVEVIENLQVIIENVWLS